MNSGTMIRISLVCLIFCGLLFNPYSFAVSDHTYQIPFLKSIFQPNLYLRDLTVSMKNYYSTFFYVFVWLLKQLFGFKLAFFIIYLFTQIVFFLSIYLIASTLFKEKLVGLISLGFLIFPQNVLGGISTFDSIVEPRTTAVVLILFAVYLLLIDRNIWAAVFLSLALNIHFITFIDQALFLMIAFLINYLLCQDKIQLLKKYRLFSFVLFLGSLPILVKGIFLSPPRSSFTIVDPVWLKMILIRSSHHFYPDHKMFLSFIFEALLILIFLVGLKVFYKKSVRQAVIIYISSMASMLFGYFLACIFINYFPVLLGIQLSFFRASYMFVIFSYIVCAYIFYTIIQQISSRLAMGSKKLFLLLLLFLIFISSLFFYHRERILIGNPFKDVNNANIDAQKWLKVHTTKDALILTPPYEEDFRIFSERSTLGSWKDWTYNCLSRDFAFSMFERLHDVGNISLVSTVNNGNDQIKSYYLNLKEDSLAKIAARYKVDYIVMERLNPLAFKKVYENDRYFIYKI